MTDLILGAIIGIIGVSCLLTSMLIYEIMEVVKVVVIIQYKLMKKETYNCQFSPDGKHWITDSSKQINKAWNFLTGTETKRWKMLNPFGKVRIINNKTGYTIGDKV